VRKEDVRERHRATKASRHYKFEEGTGKMLPVDTRGSTRATKATNEISPHPFMIDKSLLQVRMVVQFLNS
jgi:hypothetical protein